MAFLGLLASFDFVRAADFARAAGPLEAARSAFLASRSTALGRSLLSRAQPHSQNLVLAGHLHPVPEHLHLRLPQVHSPVAVAGIRCASSRTAALGGFDPWWARSNLTLSRSTREESTLGRCSSRRAAERFFRNRWCQAGEGGGIAVAGHALRRACTLGKLAKLGLVNLEPKWLRTHPPYGNKKHGNKK